MSKQSEDHVSSTRGDAAWREATDGVAQRNAAAKKAGRAERDAYEQRKADSRRVEDQRRMTEFLKGLGK